MKIDTLQLKRLFHNAQLTEFQEYKNKMLHFLLWQKLVETSFWLLLKIDCCFLQKSYLLHTKAQSLYSWFEKLTLLVHSKSQNN